jgi:hypothetical protein
MARTAKLVNCAAIQIVEGKTLVLCRGNIGKCVHNTLHSKEDCAYKKARRGKAEGFLCTSWEAKKELAKQLFYEMEQQGE